MSRPPSEPKHRTGTRIHIPTARKDGEAEPPPPVDAGPGAHRGGLGEDDITVSRGLGRCQRRIVQLLEESPERRANRAEIERVLVCLESFHESNVLRAIRSLARQRYVIFDDGHRKENSYVKLLPKRDPISEDWLFEVLRQIGGR
jgi:hypothetical protein